MSSGKLGQRSTLHKHEYFKDPTQYFACVFDPANIVHCIKIVNENMMYVEYSKEVEFVEDLGNTNAIIASWVTAQARLKLFSYLQPLGDRVLYMDTG